MKLSRCPCHQRLGIFTRKYETQARRRKGFKVQEHQTWYCKNESKVIAAEPNWHHLLADEGERKKKVRKKVSLGLVQLWLHLNSAHELGEGMQFPSVSIRTWCIRWFAKMLVKFLYSEQWGGSFELCFLSAVNITSDTGLFNSMFLLPMLSLSDPLLSLKQR